MFRRHKNTLILPLMAAFLLAILIEIKVQHQSLRTIASTNIPGAEPELSVLQDPGANRPGEGRSYFDIVFSKQNAGMYSYEIPYPLEKYIERIKKYSALKLNSNEEPGVIGAIFPMGRSLQRNAAIHGLSKLQSTDPYFRFPRVVLGVDGETDSGTNLHLNLKNKLFTGYNEKAEILEIISYNENLGRYEYQIVNDYAEGKIPKVHYANRAVCLSCHQNQAPIFSKAPWSESNANPLVATELSRVLKNTSYHGIATAIDQIITSRLDTSTDQANLLPTYQKIWKELCSGPDCRKNIFKSILLYRLGATAGISVSESSSGWLQNFEAAWQQLWPNGLAILSSDIPNRDPFKDVSTNLAPVSADTIGAAKLKTVSDLLLLSRIPAQFEPLVPRRAGETWMNSGVDSNMTNRLVRGLGKEFSQSDIRLIDKWLGSQISNHPVKLKADCQIEKMDEALAVQCKPTKNESFRLSFYYKKNSTETPVTDFSVISAALENQADTNLIAQIRPDNSKLYIFLKTANGHFSYRTSNGLLASQVLIDLTTGEASIELYDQAPLIEILSEQSLPALSKPIFSHYAIMKSLMATIAPSVTTYESLERPGLPLFVDSEDPVSPPDSSTQGFNLIKNNCAECHRNSEGAPPNFLGAPSDNLSDNDLCRRIEMCAPRMMYRLKMRLCQTDDLPNKKSPMPPDFFLSRHAITKDAWMKQYNPKILSFLNQLTSESDLARDIESSGMTQTEATSLAKDVLSDECPASSSILYEHLPKCEFDELKASSRCR